MARTCYVTARRECCTQAAAGQKLWKPEGVVSTHFAFAEAKWQLDGRSAAGVTAWVAPAAGWHD
jgi:hypothetical protein